MNKEFVIIKGMKTNLRLINNFKYKRTNKWRLNRKGEFKTYFQAVKVGVNFLLNKK